MISMEKLRDVALMVASIAATIWFALGIAEATGSDMPEPIQEVSGESRFESQILIQLRDIVEANCQIAYQTAQLQSTGLPVRTAPCP